MSPFPPKRGSRHGDCRRKEVTTVVERDGRSIEPTPQPALEIDLEDLPARCAAPAVEILASPVELDTGVGNPDQLLSVLLDECQIVEFGRPRDGSERQDGAVGPSHDKRGRVDRTVDHESASRDHDARV